MAKKRKNNRKKLSITPRVIREQETIVAWAKDNAHEIPELSLLYAVNLGSGGGSLISATLLRAGYQKHAPALCLPIARGGYIGLYIEMQYEQHEFLDLQNTAAQERLSYISMLEEQGHLVIINSIALMTCSMLRSYLKGKNRRD